MRRSEIARLIIRIEENINLDSMYYGQLVKWRDEDKNLWHYGIGLSNTHFFNIGTQDAKELQLLKRHEFIEQRDLDIRVIYEIYSPFESDEIIERLKYALRWLSDLPEDSPINKQLSGQGLASLIFTDEENFIREKIFPQRPESREIDFKEYLTQNSPQQQKPSRVREFFKKGSNWVYIFLFLFTLTFIGLIPGIESEIWWIKWGSKLVICLAAALLLAISFVRISNFKWSGFQKKNFWDWLELLIVPLMLAVGAIYLNAFAEARDKKIAEQKKQQEILKDYFSKMQNFVIPEAKNANISGTQTNTETFIINIREKQHKSC